jgi:hypothetical protein
VGENTENNLISSYHHLLEIEDIEIKMIENE